MRSILTILILAGLSALAADQWDVIKSADVDARLAKVGQSAGILSKPNYGVVMRANAGSASAWQIHPGADEFWFVRRGAAKVSLANFTLMIGVAGPSKQQYDVAAGDLVSVPREKAYSIAPGPGRFEYVAVRVFPAERHPQRVGSGASAERKLMPTVVSKSEIDAKMAGLEKNETLHSAGAVIVNYIVAPPSWPKPSVPESHMSCDDFYSVRLGTANFAVDGYIVDPREQPAGEIHGASAVGARQHSVGPGDLVSIPRNTMHYVVPQGPRFGYLLLKVCD